MKKLVMVLLASSVLAGCGAGAPNVDYEVGECFRVKNDSRTAIEKVSCDDVHHGVVFELYESSVVEFDQNHLDSEAYRLCDIAFEEYVGIDAKDSVYNWVAVTPKRDEWNSGERTVACSVTDPDFAPIDDPEGAGI